MRRPNDPKDPKGTDEEKPKPGGHARDRMDLFNKQRGLPTDAAPPGKNVEEADKAPPKSKKTDD